MKLVATIANLIPISFGLYLVIFDNLHLRSLLDFFAILSIGVVPFLNIIALYTLSGENWISLYLKRKALEEKRRIDELESKF